MDAMNREHYRVPVEIKVFYCLDTQQARTAMVTDYQIWAAHPPATLGPLEQALQDMKLMPQELKPISTMLQWLNFKMDILLYQMRLNSRTSIFSKFLTTADLSVKGFGFAESIEGQVGDRLLLALHMPDDPIHPIYTVGTLMRNGPEHDGSQALGAITFLEITEACQERIARFTFDCERKLKRGASQGSNY